MIETSEEGSYILNCFHRLCLGKIKLPIDVQVYEKWIKNDESSRSAGDFDFLFEVIICK